LGEIILASCGGALVGGLFSVITWILNRRAVKKDKSEAQKGGIAAGVQILLYNQIKTLACAHIKKGEITTEDLEDLMRMHKIYHDELHGNGYLDELMHAVLALKIV
jgi:hypothetical protein